LQTGELIMPFLFILKISLMLMVMVLMMMVTIILEQVQWTFQEEGMLLWDQLL
jgi:hypothetical protein